RRDQRTSCSGVFTHHSAEKSAYSDTSCGAPSVDVTEAVMCVSGYAAASTESGHPGHQNRTSSATPPASNVYVVAVGPTVSEVCVIGVASRGSGPHQRYAFPSIRARPQMAMVRPVQWRGHWSVRRLLNDQTLTSGVCVTSGVAGGRSAPSCPLVSTLAMTTT